MGNQPKTSVPVSNHLITSAKFTFEILGLKHIYKLFAVRELQWKGGASAITFRRKPNALQVASERTTMEEVVPNPNILVSKFRTV